MGLFLVTAPTSAAITVDDAKLHLKIDTSEDDPLVDAWIAAAQEYVETGTRRKFLRQTWDLKLDAFPDGCIWLPFPPVSSVTSISYIDTAGTTQTWATSNYTTDLPTGPHARMARIAPAYQIVYPQTRDVVNAVTVRFVCGYGTSLDDAPASMRAALRLALAYFYEHRGDAGRDTSDRITETIHALCWQYRAS